MYKQNQISELTHLQSVIKPNLPSSSLLLPNGDDAAVLRIGTALLAISVDSIREGRHFSFDYFSPKQVGSKAIEVAVSDIIAVGGKPTHVLVALSAPDLSRTDFFKEIYEGIYLACERTSCVLIGGDTSSGSSGVELCVTALGTLQSEKHICPRGGAKKGDLIYVTGPLGGSYAGLQAFKARLSGYKEVKRLHTEPHCRIDLAEQLSPFASAMIDISDGLSSEIYHICRTSNCGAIILQDKVPVHNEAKQVAEILKEDIWSYVYGGGEDYELLYTISPEDKKEAVGWEIGVIQEENVVLLEDGGKRQVLECIGYDHVVKN